MLMSVLTDLAQRAESDGATEVLSDDGISLSFSDLHNQALAVGTYLRSLGVAKGDRVGVLTSKTHEQPVAQLGVLCAEAVFVPISDLLKPEQVRYIARDCGLRAAIVDHDKVDRLGDLASDISIIATATAQDERYSTLHSIVRAGLIDARPQVIASDNAAIIYSSGSTGMPKGIVLSHRNLWDGARIISNYLGLQADDRIAGLMSFNFDYGLNQVFCSLHVGSSVHLKTFHFPKDVFQFLEDKAITTLPLMPVFLNRLFDPRFFKPSFAQSIASLRRITTTGGRLPETTLDAMRAAFPESDIYLMFGLTESFRSTYLDPSQVTIRPTSIGKAIPDVEIMVLDEEGKPCPPEVPGELVHRGGVMSKGYWNAPEKTAERFRPWPDASGNTETVVFSGDLVRRDAEGYLYFIGRRDNMIKTSGHRVSPEEIERAVDTMPGITDAVAFGRQHDVLGEEIILMYTLEDPAQGPDEFEIKSYLRERLAAYMVPHVVMLAEEFSVTAGNQGKIDRETAKKVAFERLEKKA